MSSSFYLGHTPFRVRWLDVPALAIETTDVVNKLMVIGGYHVEHVLWFGAVTLQSDGGPSPAVTISCDQELGHDGGFNDLQVVNIPGIGDTSRKVVLTASSKGSVTRVPLQVDNPSATVTLLEEPSSTVGEPWLSDFTGAVNSVDVWEAQTVLAVGGDGTIATAPLEADSSQSTVWKAPSSASSYSQGRWTGSTLFVTTGSAGGLQCWDTRAQAKPISRSPLSWGPSGIKGDRSGEVFSLAVHPSRPNVCATGGSNGSVVVWDLRFTKQPSVAAYGGPDMGPVWEVAFDEAGTYSHSTSDGNAPIIFCTESGQLLRTTAGPSVLPMGSGGPSAPEPSALLSGYGAINSFDVEATYGRDVVFATDMGALLYVQRPERMP